MKWPCYRHYCEEISRHKMSENRKKISITHYFENKINPLPLLQRGFYRLTFGNSENQSNWKVKDV